MLRILRHTAVAFMTAACAAAAHADFVGVLQPGPIGAGTSVAFQNSNVAPGTVSANGEFDFLDQWGFTLDGDFNVSAITAAINFRTADGSAVLLGISDLQMTLVSASSPSTMLTSWQTISAPVNGLEEIVSLVPSTVLGSGDYTLEIRGDVTQPGSYSGSLLAVPVRVVPLPEPLALLASGLAVLGFLGHRSRPR